MLRLRALPALAAGTLLLLSGCSSISKGVTEAVLEHKAEDTRQCLIDGPKFDGLRQSLARQAEQHGVTKVLMVHGIGPHLPGYANRFRDNIIQSLGLNVTDTETKTMAVADGVSSDTDRRATLTVTRHTDSSGSRVLQFYELTWANLTQPQKEQLAYDSENTEGLARARINKSLKGFLNQTVPDMLIYMGAGQTQITGAVQEATCWMLSSNWEQLPARGNARCKGGGKANVATLRKDEAFFITHSLGSLITVDTIQSFARDLAVLPQDLAVTQLRSMLRDKHFTVFMLSNQLPLLQLGRKPQKALNRLDDFCGNSAPLGSQRVLGRLNVIAFSDPNDILSYPVQDDFARNTLDSRLCAQLVNVSLNVAQEKDLFGAASFADPLSAHSGYLADERVARLITDGVHDSSSQPQCRWQERRSLMSAPARGDHKSSEAN